MAALNKSCGSNITVRFDWSAVPEADLVTYGAEKPLRPRWWASRASAPTRPARARSRSRSAWSVVCGFTGERSVTLKNGALDYKIDFKSFNDGIRVFEYLQNNL